MEPEGSSPCPQSPGTILSQLIPIYMLFLKYRWLSLYVLSLSAISHFRCFISVSCGASISYPRPLPSRPTELRAQFRWLAPPLWLQELQIKDSHGVSLRKSTGMLCFPFYALSIVGTWRFTGTQPPRITRVTCIHFKNILPSTPRAPKWSLPSAFRLKCCMIRNWWWRQSPKLWKFMLYWHCW
jgi:hypothetical protein